MDWSGCGCIVYYVVVVVVCSSVDMMLIGDGGWGWWAAAAGGTRAQHVKSAADGQFFLGNYVASLGVSSDLTFVDAQFNVHFPI